MRRLKSGQCKATAMLSMAVRLLKWYLAAMGLMSRALCHDSTAAKFKVPLNFLPATRPPRCLRPRAAAQTARPPPTIDRNVIGGGASEDHGATGSAGVMHVECMC